MNIYVGNISRTATEQDLKDAFAAFGEVSSSSIIKDKFSGESRGFGFVEMPNKDEGDKAIAGLNGKNVTGRPLTGTDAPRPVAPAGGGGGGGGGVSGVAAAAAAGTDRAGDMYLVRVPKNRGVRVPG